ncbi:hypothetical protein EI94DRAFT_1709737 [Lactarius quietus]|nr:hypothetical protein EI94DRAFT_1709737 [Lactarius quietus]
MTQATNGTHSTDDAGLTNIPDTADSAEHANTINTTDTTDADHPDKAPLVTRPAVPPVEVQMEDPPTLPPIEPLLPLHSPQHDANQLEPLTLLVIDWFPHSEPGSSKELNDFIDTLPGRPSFECHTFIIGGESLELYFQDILSCIQLIYGDPAFAQDLVVSPEQHYADQEWTECVYSKMYTGDWWWAVQMSLESVQPGAMVVPLIISLDKMQLMQFRGGQAYPVILAPIMAYSEIGIEMMSGDGIWCWCHPIFTTFVGDYPEQACHNTGQKPVYHPFWETILLMNMFISITPYILHQLLQGIVKHLVTWVITTFGVTFDIDDVFLEFQNAYYTVVTTILRFKATLQLGLLESSPPSSSLPPRRSTSIVPVSQLKD